MPITTTTPPGLIGAHQRQGVAFALAAGERLGAVLLRFSRWARERAAQRRQHDELAVIPEAAGRDLGIDVALLRQAPDLPSSAGWRLTRQR